MDRYKNICDLAKQMRDEKRHNISLIADYQRAFNPETVIKILEELDSAEQELKRYRDRYVFHENQALCNSYCDDGSRPSCDGDLVGEQHEIDCPARPVDLLLRPYLYEKKDTDELHI